MAQITNKLVHFNNKTDFDSRIGDIRDDSIVFVKDATIIQTHQQPYYCGSGPVALKSELATVATTGSYNDLSDKPEFPDVSELATKSELSNYLPLSGGSMTGGIDLSNATPVSAAVPNAVLALNGKQIDLGGGFTIGDYGGTFKYNNKVVLTEDNYSDYVEVPITTESFGEFVKTYEYYENQDGTYRWYFPSMTSSVLTEAEGGESTYRRIMCKEDVSYLFAEKFTTGIDNLSSTGIWTNPSDHNDNTWFAKYTTMSSDRGMSWVARDKNGNSCFNRIGASYVYANNGFFESAFSSSDIRLKNITGELNGKESLENLSNLSTVRFQWKESGKDAIGLIAQEVEKVYPEIVSEHQVTGMKGISYEHLVPVLISAIKYMQQEIKELKDEISKK